jgi:hypothetical protein
MTLREAADRIAALEENQAQILEELRLLRRGSGRADEESMVAFLELVRDVFGESPWTSGKVLAMAFDQPVLRGTIVRVIGEHPTVQGLGKFLMSNLGVCGTFRLLCLRKHTEYGAQFRLTECVSASAEKPARVRQA